MKLFYYCKHYKNVMNTKNMFVIEENKLAY